MYVNDFDHNGKSEFIVNWYPPKENKAFPFASKRDMSAQVPFIRKAAPKYEDYARMTYEDLFPEKTREGTIDYKCSILSNSILWNNGKFKFNLTPLPLDVQVAPI